MATTLSMASHRIQTLFTGLLLLALVSRTNGLAITYCSPDNTGSDFSSVYNLYQTNNECSKTCGTDYVYAVIQGQYCWCSNYVPADTVSTYDCNQVCPGWPDDWCGSTEQGLYGYYQLVNRAPSGTAGGSSPTSASYPSVSNTPSSSGSSIGASPSLTVVATVQSTRTSILTVETTSIVPVVVPVPTTSSTTSSSSSSSSSSASSTSSEPTTSVYTSVTTVTGQVRTTVISVAPTSTDSTLGSNTPISSNNGGGSSVSTGKVVGIVVGVALGLGLLIGLGVWLWLRRRHQRNLENASLDGSSVHGNTGIPSRQVSQMSSAGLLHKTPRIITSGLPPSNNPRSADTNGTLDRRSLGTDQRLNPYAIYAHDESRHSNVSLQDNQDYSRQLRVANPDP